MGLHSHTGALHIHSRHCPEPDRSEKKKPHARPSHAHAAQPSSMTSRRQPETGGRSTLPPPTSPRLAPPKIVPPPCRCVPMPPFLHPARRPRIKRRRPLGPFAFDLLPSAARLRCQPGCQPGLLASLYKRGKRAEPQGRSTSSQCLRRASTCAPDPEDDGQAAHARLPSRLCHMAICARAPTSDLPEMTLYV